MTEPRKAAITPKQAERLRAIAQQREQLRHQHDAMLAILWPYDGPATVELVDGDEGPELVELAPPETKEP